VVLLLAGLLPEQWSSENPQKFAAAVYSRLTSSTAAPIRNFQYSHHSPFLSLRPW
jgi:hypothetical protein